MDKAKLYSPIQVLSGSFFGGPGAVVYVLWKNFRVLGNSSAATQTLVWGGLFIIAIFLVMPFLPERFPNYALPIAYAALAQFIAQKYQMTKQAIAESEQYEFQSNWNVFAVSVGFLVAFVAIGIIWMLALDHFGVIKL